MIYEPRLVSHLNVGDIMNSFTRMGVLGGDALVWTSLLLCSGDGRAGRAMRVRGGGEVGGARRLDGVREIAK